MPASPCPRMSAAAALRAVHAMLAAALLGLLMWLGPGPALAQGQGLDAFREELAADGSANPAIILHAFTRLPPEEQAAARAELLRAKEDAEAAGDQPRASMLSAVLAMLPAQERPEAEAGDAGEGGDRAAAVPRSPGLDAFRQQIEAGAFQELPKTFSSLSPYEKGLALDMLETRMDEAYAEGDERTYNGLDLFYSFLPAGAIRKAAEAASSQPSAAVFGQVSEAGTGRPVAGATIASGTYKTTSGEDGSYRLERIYPGRHRISVTASARYAPFEAELFLLPDRPQELNIALSEAGGAALGGIAGVIRDADGGDPIRSITVMLMAPGGAGGPRTATTDAEGRFSFEDVPAGEARLVLDPFAQGAGYYAANGNRLFERLEMPLDVSAGKTASPTIALATIGPKPIERTATIKGTIRDLASGAPIAGAKVFIGRKSATSGPDGSFRVRQIQTGRRKLIAEHPDYLDYRRDLGELGPGIRETEILMQPAGTGNLEGQVLDADSGQVLAGASVAVGDRQATADDQGRFRLLGLPAGDLNLSAAAERYKPASQALSLAEGETAGVTIRLAPVTTGWIAGLVLDAETGAPLPGATVFIGDERLRAGPDGAFRSGELAEGEALVTAQHEGYRPEKMNLRVFAGQEVGAVLELAPITTGSLALTVLDDETGQPLEGAIVRILDREGRTDAGGRVRFAEIPAGGHSVVADHPGHVPGEAALRIRRAAETEAELRLKPILTGDVVGRVINARDGSPVPGAAIGGPQGGVIADEKGRFRLPGLMAGRILLSASAPLFTPAELSIDLARNDIADVTFALEPITHGAVRGHVVDAATGTPLASARLRIGGAEVSTDASGAFAFGKIEAGDLRLAASRAGYHPLSRPLKLAPGETLDLTLKLEPITHGAVRGHVVDAATGKALASAEVRIGSAQTVTDATGAFAFEKIAIGDIEAQASHAGYLPGQEAARLEPGRDLDLTIRLEPEPPGVLSGRIVDSQSGAPIAGALVTVGGQTAETDANGNYRFEGVKAGAAEIEVRYPGYRAEAGVGTVPPGAGGRLDIALSKREETAGEISSALSDSGAIDLYGIHFDVNKDQFTPQSLPTLHALKAYLDAHPGEAFILEGHTDSDGSEAFNQDLSERRAATVLRWLANSGTDISNIRAVGMGETAPVASNATRAGKALNRRVVLRRADDGSEISGEGGGN